MHPAVEKKLAARHRDQRRDILASVDRIADNQERVMAAYRKERLYNVLLLITAGAFGWMAFISWHELWQFVQHYFK